jgi:hypothetical protein
MIETFLKKTGAHLWMQHDTIGNAKLRKSPKFYDQVFAPIRESPCRG